MRWINVFSVKRERTEYCKAIRRIYGDNSGMCRFSDKQMSVGTEVMSTIMTLPSKDNLAMELYD